MEKRLWRFLLCIFLGACTAAPNPARVNHASPEKGSGMKTISDSHSQILRSPGILWIHVQQADFGAAGSSPLGKDFRKVILKVTLKEAFKGAYQEPKGALLNLEVSQYVNPSTRTFAYPGPWSNVTVEPGHDFVVFSKASGGSVVAALNDSGAEKVFAAEKALEDVRLAAQIEKESRNLEETLRLAAAEAPKLDFLFADFLWARGSDNALKNPADYAHYIQFLESSGLTYGLRYTLLSSIDSPVTANPDLDPGYANRLGLAMFRILALQNETEIKENILDVYLPNLLAMESHPIAKTPTDIFKNHASEKAKAEEFLAHYKGSVNVQPLLDWIRKP